MSASVQGLGRVGAYVLEGVVGRGSAATVYRARHYDWHDRLVALKRVDGADGAGRARAEADVLAALDHPHIVRVLDLVPDGDGVAIAMQYASGGTLAGLLARRGPLDPDEAVAVAAPLADALASAHRRGVLHGDVAPANVLLTADGEPLLSDFGVATRGRGADGPARVVGTPGYLDPAVAAGGPADERSDVYALGAVCYEMLAGRPPHEGATPEAALAAAPVAPVPLALACPGVPPALAAAVERAMAPDPAGRFGDAASFAAALRAAAPAAPAGVRPPAPEAGAATLTGAPCTRDFGPRPPVRPPPESRGRRPRRRFAIGAAIAVAVAVPVVAVAAAAPPGGGQRPAPAAAHPAPACPSPSGALAADVDGDGCPEGVSWNGSVAEVAGQRYRFGRPGDVLLLGDWDCDGKDTPALFRPATGTVHLFPAWAGPGHALVATEGPRGPVGGTARVVAAGPGGCDRVEVGPAPEG